MSDTPLGAMYFGFIITTVLAIYLPVVFLALGLAWAPFAAGISAISARKKGLGARRHAVAGALYSALMFCPWVYFMLRMNGRSVPAILVRLFYISVFTTWTLGSIFWTFAVAIAHHPGTDSLYEFSNPWVVFSYIVYALLFAKIGVWFVSLRTLLKRRRRELATEAGENALIALVYLTPPAFTAVSLAITAFALFGLTRIWTSIFGEIP